MVPGPQTAPPLPQLDAPADSTLVRHAYGNGRGELVDFGILDEAGHRVKVERVRQLIGDGDVYQVNLTFKLRGGSGDPFATYIALREKARSGGCAFLRFGDEDILSFSPELFFRAAGARISARPMKGTAARGPSIEDDARQRSALLADEKQRAENLMIVDLLRNDLARVARPGSVEVTDLFTTETYPRFHTLTSGIEADVDGAVTLWVNGEEVNGGTRCQPASGALALEAEGARVEYRNLRLRELP